MKSVGKTPRNLFSFSSVPRAFFGFVFIHSKISARVPATSKSLDIFSVTFWRKSSLAFDGFLPVDSVLVRDLQVRFLLFR